MRVLNISENDNFEQFLLEKAFFLFNRMESYNIREVIHDYRGIGIDTQFYLTWEDRVLYIPNIKFVENKEWINLINNSKKLDDNWYYYNIYD